MIAKYQLDYKKKEVWRRERQNLEETRGLHFWQGPEGLFKQGPFIPMDILRWNLKEKGYMKGSYVLPFLRGMLIAQCCTMNFKNREHLIVQ